ncbi:GapS4b family protein [Halpernia sp. GG3]
MFFLGHNQKNNSVPLIMKSIISPKDFLELYETQKTREETNKYRTSSINCKTDFDFPDIFSNALDLNSLIREKHTYKPNFSVIGNPNFYFEDEFTAVYEYQIERENLLSDWTNNKTYHKGAVTLKKISDTDIQISVQQDSTSKETFEVNKLIMVALKEKLFEKSIIKSYDDIISVRYNHFNNTSRIKFFYSFTSNFTIYLDFKSITDIDLYLDENVESHKDVKIFLDEIDNLKLSGKGLQNHVLIYKEDYYPKLIFGAVKYKYKLNYNGIEGNAVINLGFPDFVKSKDENADFQISIDLILNRQDKIPSIENKIRKKLLEFFEKKKIESYNRFKIL